MKIFINPGHGRNSTTGVFVPGAVGPTDLIEADINFRVGQLLNSKIGGLCTTKLYQDANHTVVCNEANLFQSDYFVSIHCNAHADRSANGTETYCYALGGQGEKLARSVQTELIKALKLRDRGVKTANFEVLRGTKATAILVELGFISNPAEEALMKNAQWLDSAAEALAIGISNYVGLVYPPPPPIQEEPEPNRNLFRVQVGSYSSIANAEAMLKRVQDAGFKDAFITQG